MPTYLLHGFRWPRMLINIYMIQQDLKDSTCNWLMATNTVEDLLNNFHEKYPSVMEALPNLRFIEEYSVNQIEASSPYGYVADTLHEVIQSVDIDEIRQQPMSDAQWSAICELRDHLCSVYGADASAVKLGWYVVVCDDPERLDYPEGVDGETNGIDEDGEASTIKNGDVPERKSARRGSLSHGLRKVFGLKKVRKSASLRDLQNPNAMKSSRSNFSNSMTTASPSPPPPPIPVQYRDEVARLRSKSQGNMNQRPATSGAMQGVPLPGTAK